MTAEKVEVRVVEDAWALVDAAAGEFIRLAVDAVARRGRFTVALSGGSTPKGLYESLAAGAGGRPSLPWNAVHLFWGDERQVPPDHPVSNYRMVREALLDRAPIPPENVHRIAAGRGDAERVAREYDSELRSFFGSAPDSFPRLDLILLGLGNDGHTASLFPGTDAVRETRRWVAAPWIETLSTHRITLTLPVINEAARIVFLVSGEDKAEPLRAALHGNDPVDLLPARFVRPRDGSVLWIVDRAAARLLPPSS